MIPFGLLKWRLWTKVYGSIFYNGTIIFGLGNILFPKLKKMLVPRPPKSKPVAEDLANDNGNSNLPTDNIVNNPAHNGKQD